MSNTHFGFQTVDERDKSSRVRGVFDSVASRYDVMNDLMSMGLHRLWKAYTVAIARLRQGDRVLDIAGGTGDLIGIDALHLAQVGRVLLPGRHHDNISCTHVGLFMRTVCGVSDLVKHWRGHPRPARPRPAVATLMRDRPTRTTAPRATVESLPPLVVYCTRCTLPASSSSAV